MDLENVVPPNEVLKQLTKGVLTDVYIHEHPDEYEKKPQKKAMVEKLAEAIEDAGIKVLVDNLKRDDSKAALANQDVDWKDNNKNSKAVLTRKLYEKISEAGIDDFLQANVSGDLLKAFAEAVEVDPDGKKEEVAKKISTTVRALGMESFFSSFDVNTLHSVLKDLKIPSKGTNNKRKLVEAITTKSELSVEPKRKKPKLTYSKEKKPIEKGSTYDDIFQHYYVDEVREWCREHNLKTAGNKKDLINRALKFLDGDKSEISSGSRGGGKKGKGKAKSKETEEKKDTTETSEDKNDKGKKKGKKED